MALLKIIKLSEGVWKHWSDLDGFFGLTRLYAKIENNKFLIVEAYGAKRRTYAISEIEVYNIGGSAETFANFDDLQIRLKALNYIGYDASFAGSLIDNTASHNKGDYNATTNTPDLTNGTGQIGDYYTVSVAGSRDFGAGSISFGVGDIIEYTGAIYRKLANNNQTSSSSVTLTKKTITSANLTKQDVEGFLIYVNGVTSFAIASNEIVEYLVSDTGQIFKLEVNNRSVGSGETDLTSTDVLEIEFPQETILQNIGVWVKFNQVSASHYPFGGAVLNSGAIQTSSNLAPIDKYGNAHVRFISVSGVANSGYRIIDGNNFPYTFFKGTTFFAIINPLTTTNLSAIIGMPAQSSLTTTTESTTVGAWFNITNNQIQAKCAYSSSVTTGTSQTITATEWLLCMIEVINNDAVNKRIRFKVKKTDGTVVYNEDITTNIKPYNVSASDIWTGCRAVLTSAPVVNTDCFGLSAMGFWAEKPNFLRNF